MDFSNPRKIHPNRNLYMLPPPIPTHHHTQYVIQCDNTHQRGQAVREEEVYITSSFQKQTYRYNMSKYLGTKSPDMYLGLYNQYLALKFITEINDITKKFPQKMIVRLKQDLNKYIQIATECSFYTQMYEKAVENNNKALQEATSQKLQQKSKEIPSIIYTLTLVTCYLINKTDLKSTPIPPAQILNAKDNKMPFRPRDEIHGDY